MAKLSLPGPQLVPLSPLRSLPCPQFCSPCSRCPCVSQLVVLARPKLPVVHGAVHEVALARRQALNERLVLLQGEAAWPMGDGHQGGWGSMSTPCDCIRAGGVWPVGLHSARSPCLPGLVPAEASLWRSPEELLQQLCFLRLGQAGTAGITTQARQPVSLLYPLLLPRNAMQCSAMHARRPPPPSCAARQLTCTPQ